MKAVSLFMDVEDPINPLADDAAKDFGELFSRAGIVGSFCVTGEKCRTLIGRDRLDVIDALAPHAHGLHTDTHSFHPSTMEMLWDCDFKEGANRALKTEGRGAKAFQNAFGRTPSFWGGAGNTWSPEITDALKELNIPAYSYALTQVPHHQVHKFNGVMALPQALTIGESDWMDDHRARMAIDRTLTELEILDQPWVGIFVGHPTRMRYSDYWDKPYYAGRTPPIPEFTLPVPDADYERAKRNLFSFIRKLQEVADIASISDVLSMPWRFRAPVAEEIIYFEEKTSATLLGTIGWPIHRPGMDFKAIVEKTMALKGTLEVGEIEG